MVSDTLEEDEEDTVEARRMARGCLDAMRIVLENP